MQLLAKFKKILYMGFRATLNFRKFKVALNPKYSWKVLETVLSHLKCLYFKRGAVKQFFFIIVY